METVEKLFSEADRFGTTIPGIGLRFASLPSSDDIDFLLAQFGKGITHIEVPEHDLHNPEAVFLALEELWRRGLPTIFYVGENASEHSRAEALGMFSRQSTGELPIVLSYGCTQNIQDILADLAKCGRATITMNFTTECAEKASYINRVGVDRVIIGEDYDECNIFDLPAHSGGEDDFVWDVIAKRGYRGQLSSLRNAHFTEEEIEHLTSHGPRKIFAQRAQTLSRNATAEAQL